MKEMKEIKIQNVEDLDELYNRVQSILFSFVNLETAHRLTNCTSDPDAQNIVECCDDSIKLTLEFLLKSEAQQITFTDLVTLCIQSLKLSPAVKFFAINERFYDKMSFKHSSITLSLDKNKILLQIEGNPDMNIIDDYSDINISLNIIKNRIPIIMASMKND